MYKSKAYIQKKRNMKKYKQSLKETEDELKAYNGSWWKSQTAKINQILWGIRGRKRMRCKARMFGKKKNEEKRLFWENLYKSMKEEQQNETI